MLSDGRIDIVIGGSAITPKRALAVTFTKPYIYHTAGVVVKDKFRDEFSTMENISDMEDLKIAVLGNNYYSEVIKKTFSTCRTN